jgi:nucleoside-diphosphate-sugar epimerase
MKRVFITGTAGFIGSNLVDRLLEHGLDVVGWDNVSTVQHEFLRALLGHQRFSLVGATSLICPG